MMPGDTSPESFRVSEPVSELQRAINRIADLKRQLAGRDRRIGLLERKLGARDAALTKLSAELDTERRAQRDAMARRAALAR